MSFQERPMSRDLPMRTLSAFDTDAMIVSYGVLRLPGCLNLLSMLP